LLIDPDKPGDLTDALHRILADGDLRRRSAQAGLARAATFTWQHTAEIALAVYQSVSGC
jgi:glycosyltransferase involved in cell wall biosynthesis